MACQALGFTDITAAELPTIIIATIIPSVQPTFGNGLFCSGAEQSLGDCGLLEGDNDFVDFVCTSLDIVRVICPGQELYPKLSHRILFWLFPWQHVYIWAYYHGNTRCVIAHHLIQAMFWIKHVHGHVHGNRLTWGLIGSSGLKVKCYISACHFSFSRSNIVYFKFDHSSSSHFAGCTSSHGRVQSG